MVRLHIAGTCRARVMAGAVLLTLGAGWSGQAGAQAALLSMDYVHTPAFTSDAIVPLLAGEHQVDDCDPDALDDAAPGGVMMVQAKLEVGKKTTRKKAAAATETPMADAAVPAIVPANASRDWEIVVTDKTLNATMARWAAMAGWQLLWELPVDYAVEARTRVHGTFEEAVTTVAGSMETAEIPMKAVFYQGNKVLRIMARGSE